MIITNLDFKWIKVKRCVMLSHELSLMYVLCKRTQTITPAGYRIVYTGTQSFTFSGVELCVNESKP